MTDFSAERQLAELEKQQLTARLYFTENPDPSIAERVDVDDLEDVIDDRFGYSIKDRAWDDVKVHTIDCLPVELPVLSGLVQELGFIPLLESRERTTARKLMESGIRLLPEDL